jgi:probable HAF family extracellular repeat protein
VEAGGVLRHFFSLHCGETRLRKRAITLDIVQIGGEMPQKNNRKNVLAVLLFVGLGSSMQCQAQPQLRYTVTDLGSLGNACRCSTAFGINSAGQAVGNSDNAFGGFAFRTAPNQPINPTTDNLGAFGAGAVTATGINTQGQVVGFSPTGSDLGRRAFRTAPNAAINPATDNLGTLGGDLSEAHGINDSGQVVGTSSLDDGNLAAFRTSPNAPINPATDNLGAVTSYGYGINNSGQVVGCFSIGGGQYRAFRTKANSAIDAATDDLGDLGGASSPSSPNNCALGVNDAGQAVGWANTVDGHVHAFRTAPNAALNPATDDLGTLGGTDSEAESINASGQVVGFAVGPNTNRAFIYSNGVMQDLNNLIPADSGWILAVAYGINDSGQIVGVDSSGNHAFRLDPYNYNPYGVCLLYDPDKAVKAGSTIPIKLQLCNNNGNNLSSPNTTVHAVGIAQVSNVVSGLVQDSGNANPDNDFRFDSSLGGTGGYIFNLSTVGLTTGTYKINFNVSGDPFLYSAPFQVK